MHTWHKPVREKMCAEMRVIMGYKKIRKLFISAAAILACILVFNPISAYATQSGGRNMILEKDVSLDSSHSIHIYVNAYVEYSYDEGVYGWINNITISDDSGVVSNEVNVETLQAVDGDETGYSTYWIRYLFCGHSFLEDYRGYINIYFNCDEWGDLSGWITYDYLSNESVE